VADHTKVNRVAIVMLAPLSTMNTFVTDINVDKKFAQLLKKQGIQVVIA
jgi:DeoR/GlpR family transcriptional regulator of sugar metabolism